MKKTLDIKKLILLNITGLSAMTSRNWASSLKELAAALGKETVDTYNTGESRGREFSFFLEKSRLQKNNAKLTPSQFGGLSNHLKKL